MFGRLQVFGAGEPLSLWLVNRKWTSWAVVRRALACKWRSARELRPQLFRPRQAGRDSHRQDAKTQIADTKIADTQIALSDEDTQTDTQTGHSARQREPQRPERSSPAANGPQLVLSQGRPLHGRRTVCGTLGGCKHWQTLASAAKCCQMLAPLRQDARLATHVSERPTFGSNNVPKLQTCQRRLRAGEQPQAETATLQLCRLLARLSVCLCVCVCVWVRHTGRQQVGFPAACLCCS